MSTTIWSTFFAGAAVLVATTILAASCGGSGGSGTQSTGSGGSAPTNDCAFAGTKCSHGCVANLGCVECVGNNDCHPGAPICVV